MGRWVRESRNQVIDVLVVLLTLTVGLSHDTWDGAGDRSLAYLFDVALALPLLGRRRAPIVVFLAVSAVALVQWWTGQVASGDFAVLAALYAVGAYEAWRPGIAVAAVIAETGVVLAVLRWAPPGQGLVSGVLLTGTVSAALVLGMLVRTHRAYLQSVLDRADTAERERDQLALIAAATERARISGEMHDIVAHSLSVMIALSDGAAVSVARAPGEARTAMEQSSVLGRQALGEIRRLLGTLDPGAAAELAPQPGVAQLDELVEQVRGAGLAVDLVVIGRPPELPASAQLALYRMVQEALTNVLKHAPSATGAAVTLRYSGTGVDIEVENDSSAGFLAREPEGTGRGLAGMRARAAVFGGTVEAGPRDGGGGWLVRGRLRLTETAR